MDVCGRKGDGATGRQIGDCESPIADQPSARKQVTMIRKYHNHTLGTYPRHPRKMQTNVYKTQTLISNTFGEVKLWHL